MQGEWELVKTARQSPIVEAGLGAVRVALLFGSAAIALALIVTPAIDRSTRGQVALGGLMSQLDMTATGSIGEAGGRYTLRRSVLQSSPSAVCVIRDSGVRAGDC